MPRKQPISEKQIDRAIKALNEASGNPVDCLAHNGAWATGCFIFSNHLGKYALERVTSDTGSLTKIAPRGTKRELYERIFAMIDGINLVKPPLG